MPRIARKTTRGRVIRRSSARPKVAKKRNFNFGKIFEFWFVVPQ